MLCVQKKKKVCFSLGCCRWAVEMALKYRRCNLCFLLGDSLSNHALRLFVGIAGSKPESGICCGLLPHVQKWCEKLEFSLALDLGPVKVNPWRDRVLMPAQSCCVSWAGGLLAAVRTNSRGRGNLADFHFSGIYGQFEVPRWEWIRCVPEEARGQWQCFNWLWADGLPVRRAEEVLQGSTG